MRTRTVRLAVLVVLCGVASALPLRAEEPAAKQTKERSPLVGAAWCQVGQAEAGASGCDVGLGVALYRWHHLAAVAVVGQESVGAGLAWVVTPSDYRGPSVAVAVGMVAHYDSSGIQTDPQPALGVTIAFTGRKD